MIRDDEMIRLRSFSESNHYFNVGKNRFDPYFETQYLSKNAHFLISKYLGGLSSMVNRDLRSSIKKKGSFLVLYEYLLNKALDELPTCRDEVVYRMDTPIANIDFDIIKIWYQKRIGQVIMFPNFLSTSKDRWNNESIVFKIKTTVLGGAKDLSEISDKLNEKEVLFKSRSKFKIVGINEKEEYIKLNEVKRNYSKVIIMNDCTYINDKEIGKLLGMDEYNDEDQTLSLSDRGLI